MRHRKTTKKLDRKSDPRKALFRSLVTNLIIYEKIKTTEAKAKAIKPIAEKLITKAKKNTLISRRMLTKYLYTPNAIKKMLEQIGPRYKNRNGGYTRIIKIGARQGDRAQIVQIELV